MNFQNFEAIRNHSVFNYVGRNIDAGALMNQIGRGNILAMNGGRGHHLLTLDTVLIGGVGAGYHVTVTLAADDTYTVRRWFARGGKATVKTEVWGVYADQVGEIAYQASCYKD
jgi:hypothetical protein